MPAGTVNSTSAALVMIRQSFNELLELSHELCARTTIPRELKTFSIVMLAGFTLLPSRLLAKFTMTTAHEGCQMAEVSD